MPDPALPVRLLTALAPAAPPTTKAALVAACDATQTALHAEIARLTELAARHALAVQWLQKVPDDVLALIVAVPPEDPQ